MDGLLAVLDTRVGNRTYNRRYGTEYSGPCPWCGGTDRFHVWPEAYTLPGVGTPGWYRCMGAKVGRRGCDRKGDGITYLQEYRGMSFREACRLLGIDPDALLAYRRAEQGSSPSLPPAVQRRARELSPADRNTLWQEQAALIARLAHHCLCSERGREARAYLEARGLDDSIVREAHLGYCRAYARLDAVPWGLDRGMLRLPRGLVLPWYDEADRVVCLRLRRLPGDESDEAREFYGMDPCHGAIKRYRVIFGSSTEHLYREGTLHPGQDAVLARRESWMPSRPCKELPVALRQWQLAAPRGDARPRTALASCSAGQSCCAMTPMRQEIGLRLIGFRSLPMRAAGGHCGAMQASFSRQALTSSAGCSSASPR